MALPPGATCGETRRSENRAWENAACAEIGCGGGACCPSGSGAGSSAPAQACLPCRSPCSEKRVSSAQTTRVGPCIPVGRQPLSDKRLRLAQLLGQRGAFLTCVSGCVPPGWSRTSARQSVCARGISSAGPAADQRGSKVNGVDDNDSLDQMTQRGGHPDC